MLSLHFQVSEILFLKGKGKGLERINRGIRLAFLAITAINTVQVAGGKIKIERVLHDISHYT